MDAMNDMALRVSEEAVRIEENLQAASRKAVQEHDSLFSEAEERWKIEASTPKPVSTKVATIKPSGAPWSEKIEKMRADYPNAYKPWSEDDDEKLQKLFKEGKKVKQLTDDFGRHPGSIRARLKKHFGEDWSKK